MMKKPLVSVIVPVYNIERYVERCLESLIAQSYGALEIIVVDDGSTDKSGVVCDGLAKQDARIKVFHKKNGGLSDARNFGIKKARGEVMALVDGDDYVEPDYVEVMIRAMQDNDADVVICGFNNVKPKKTILDGKKATVKLLTEQENLEIVAWNKLYKKKLFVENNIWYPIGVRNEDNLTTYRLFTKAKKVAYVDRMLYHYETRSDSIMETTKVEERLAMREKAAVEAVEYLRDDEDLRQAAEVSLLLAKYAYIDAAMKGEIAAKWSTTAMKWVKIHRKELTKNKYMTNKLRVYMWMTDCLGGVPYKIFRKMV